jgi:hypothetical protein
MILQLPLTRGQCYKTLFVRDLRNFGTKLECLLHYTRKSLQTLAYYEKP